MVLTVHRWYANKACPGDWLYSRLSHLAAKVTAALGTPVASTGLQAASLKDMESAEVVTKVATLFTASQKQSGILASVSMAQFILESGYGKSELPQNANNCFGMKSSLSGTAGLALRGWAFRLHHADRRAEHGWQLCDRHGRLPQVRLH